MLKTNGYDAVNLAGRVLILLGEIERVRKRTETAVHWSNHRMEGKRKRSGKGQSVKRLFRDKKRGPK